MKRTTGYTKLIIITSVCATGMLFQSGCKKFIEVDAPITSINQDNIYNDNNNATSVLTGIYSKMSSTYFSLYLSVLPELSSDNLYLFDSNNFFANSYFQNKLSANYTDAVVVFWNDLYAYIYDTNAAIEGLTKSTSLTENVRNRLLGEAYFLRGFYYFYLVNLYSNVPLVTSTDYLKSTTLSNSKPSEVYEQIISDLKQSQSLLDNNYVDGNVTKTTTNRVRPNLAAATALLSRCYLYTKDYNNAIIESTKIIVLTNTYRLTNLPSTFIKNSTETIWSLQPVVNNINTFEGDFFIYPDGGPNSVNYTYLSADLMNSFELGDQRKKDWVRTYNDGTRSYSYPSKYQVKNGDPATAMEYPIILRLVEQYLIRAEAKIHVGDIEGGIKDLNYIRARSRSLPSPEIPNPLPDLSTHLSQEQAIEAVLRERRAELFCEWGNRWFDLKRTETVNKTMALATVQKGGTWNSYQSIYPIPQLEIRINPNLKQNPGY